MHHRSIDRLGDIIIERHRRHSYRFAIHLLVDWVVRRSSRLMPISTKSRYNRRKSANRVDQEL